MIGRLGGFAVFVKPDKGAIQIVAGKIEIVRIAAEEGRLPFHRKHQPHVGIFAVGVKLVLAALIERDHLAAEFFFLAGTALLFHCGNLAIAGAHKILAALARRRLRNAVRDICNTRQNFGLHPGAEFFLFALGRLKTGGDVIGGGIGEFLGAVAHAMMVGQHQTVGTDHRSRTAHR